MKFSRELTHFVFDVQDAGRAVLHYTRRWVYCMEKQRNETSLSSCSTAKPPAKIIEGPVLDADQKEFRRVFPVAGALRADHR